MENIIDKYMDWKKIEYFMVFLKKSANWLSLINDDYNKSCSAKRLKKLTSAEEKDLFNHLFNYIIFEENDEIKKFYVEFKKTFNSNWMKPTERRLSS